MTCQLRAMTALVLGKQPIAPMRHEAVWLERQSRRCGEIKNLLHLLGFEIGTLGHLTRCRLVTILTELPVTFGPNTTAISAAPPQQLHNMSFDATSIHSWISKFVILSVRVFDLSWLRIHAFFDLSWQVLTNRYKTTCLAGGLPALTCCCGD